MADDRRHATRESQTTRSLFALISVERNAKMPTRKERGMQPEVNDPTPELVTALQNGTKIATAIEKLQGRISSAVGTNRRRIDLEIEGLEKRQRKNVSLIGSMLETEGFPQDYTLPEDDNNEASLIPA